MLTSTSDGATREKGGSSTRVRGCQSKAGGSVSGRALVGSSSPPSPSNTAVPWTCFLLPWLPSSYGRSLSNKNQKTVPKTLPPQLGVLCSLGGCGSGTKRCPHAAEGTLWAAACRAQALAASAGGAAPRFPSLLTGEEEEHMSREEEVQRSPRTSSFLPLHWLQHPLHPQARGLRTGLSHQVTLAPEVQRERSRHHLPSWSHLSYCSTLLCLLWHPAPLLPRGCQPRKQAHSPQVPVAQCLWLSNLGQSAPPSPGDSEHRDLVPAHRIQVIIQGQQDLRRKVRGSFRSRWRE